MQIILDFEWDKEKNRLNLEKHGISFQEAVFAFYDPNRIIEEDRLHSQGEQRFYCYGLVAGRVMTVRFTVRQAKTRIIGAAYWRKGKQRYDRENATRH